MSISKYPFTHNFNTGRSYYGPSLTDPRYQPTLWTNKSSLDSTEDNNANNNLIAASFLGAGTFASGFIKTNKGNLWDKYVPMMRGVEEYSPAAMLRTFQISNLFSQFQSVGTKGFHIDPSLLSTNIQYQNYLKSLIGEQKEKSTAGRLIREGVTLRGGSLYWGKSNDVALKYAGALRTFENIPARLSSGISRNLGLNIEKPSQFFSRHAPFGLQSSVRNPLIDKMPTTIVGGKNIFQYGYRQSAMMGTEFISRFNRLLSAPFEIEPFRSVFKGIEPYLKKVPGFKHGLGIQEGSGLKMLGKLGVKYGLGLGSLYMGWETLDHMFRTTEAFDKTLLSEGLTYGIATLGVKANLTLSQAAEVTGLHSYREAQEEIAPGSTSLTKLAAFPLMGAVVAGLSSYGIKIFKMGKMQVTEGVTAAEARKNVVKGMQSFTGKGFLPKLGKYITSVNGAYQEQKTLGKVLRNIATVKNGELAFKFIGKLGPTKLAAMMGATIGAALTLPFLPGALIPGERPDELQKIYSGEKEVAIRKGRWWEAGRSAFEGGRIMYYRPHWYTRMRQRSREKGIYGPDEENISPMQKWYKREFTYELEKEHYKDRPYPLTALPFEDVPFVGPLLAHTLGKLIKPSVLMHTEEWQKNGMVKNESPGFGERVATEIGQVPAGAPLSPHGIRGLVGEQTYRLTEMIGLPGFAMTSIKEALTGSSDLFDDTKMLETSRRMFGIERDYWDLELGGILGMSEGFRRLYPHRRRQIPLYNPIRNMMPGWLPGPGEKGPDLLHGDAYCISSDTLVEVLEGCFKPVCELTTEDKIRTHKGRWIHPKEIIKREMHSGEQLFEIKVTSLSAFPIKASEDHPFWTQEGWVKATNLKKGDYVGYPIPKLDDLIVQDNNELLDLSLYCDLPFNDSYIFIQSSQEYADCIQYIETTQSNFKRGELKSLLDAKGWNRKTFENAQRGVRLNNINRITRYIDPSCIEWGLLSGYYVAEGSCTNGAVCFSFHKNELEYHREVIDSLKYLFNLNGKVCPASQGQGVSLIVTNKALAQILPRIFGQGSYSKRLPLWTGSFIPALGALFNGDGSFFFDKNKPRLSLKSKSKKLLWEIRQFLLTFGYVGSIVEDNLVYRGQAAKDCARFISTSKYIDCSDSTRTVRHTYIKDDYVWMRIFSKIEILQESVFGIQVDVDNSFCVVGVATHNTNIQEGELRLPGEGYIARFPELQGLQPDQYPLIHKYKILGDIAPYTNKFKQMRRSVQSDRKKAAWTEYEENIWTTTEDQIKAKKSKKEFQEYEYLSPMGDLFDKTSFYDTAADDSTNYIAALNKMKSEQIPGSKDTLINKLFGGYWELLSHNAETAWDQLTPLSPGAKLVHQRTAIERYERESLYGTSNAFWNHPIRDFFRPFSNLLGQSLGFKGIPDEIQHRRNIEEYFDIMKYVKYSRLSNMAKINNDSEAIKEFESKKNQTLFGINPFTHNYTSIFRALPKRDRDYFNAFADADTTEERARILEILPDNEKALYIARWKQKFIGDVKKANKIGLLSDEQINEADRKVNEIYEEAKAEGLPTSKELWTEYIATRTQQETYPDWYRRTKLLTGIPLPGADWCFPAGTLVSTKNGYKPIENIEAGDFVYTRKGLQLVKKNISRKIDEKIIEFNWSKDTEQSISCTTEHPIFINNKWCLAKNVKIGDEVSPHSCKRKSPNYLLLSDFLPKEKYKIIDKEWITSKLPGPNQKHKNIIQLTDDLYWILGWYLAEGNIRYSENRMRGVEFTLSLDEENIANKIRNILYNIFGKMPSIKKRIRKTGSALSIVLNNQIAGYFFNALCGRWSDQKEPKIPGSKDKLLITALACLDGDGSFETNRSTLNTVSQKLAIWFRDILVANGMNISFRLQKRKNRKPQYRVSWNKKPRTLGRKITKIIHKHYSGKVYNLQVFGDNEFYTIMGLVHNCGWHPSVDLQDVKLKLIQNLGEDQHDYDLWASRSESLQDKPFINNDIIEPLIGGERLTELQIQGRINTLFRNQKIIPHMYNTTSHTGRGSINIQLEQESPLEEIMREIA